MDGLSARLKEAAGDHFQGWALTRRAGELRSDGVELKVLCRAAPLRGDRSLFGQRSSRHRA